MSRLTGTTLAGILATVVVVVGGGYLVYRHFLPPPPPPVAHVDLHLTTSPSAHNCDASPRWPDLLENGTVTFRPEQGNYTITFTKASPFTTGGLTLVIHDGDTYTTRTLAPTYSSPFPFPYVISLGGANCKLVPHDIGIIVTH
jgi:hypothetical protein